MESMQELSVLALRGVLGGACRAVGFEAGATALEGVVGLLENRLLDPSQKAQRVLARCTERAWRALEIALAGEPLLGWLSRADDRQFRQQVRTFLEAVPLPRTPDFLSLCLGELRHARKAGLLVPNRVEAQALQNLARRAAAFARYTDPSRALAGEFELLGELADRLRNAGYQALAELIEVRSQQGGPALLAVAVRFFFRQEVAERPDLFQGLTADRIDQIGQGLEAGFQSLGQALAEHAARLEQGLESIQAVVIQTHQAVLDVRAELDRQNEESRRQFQVLYETVLALQQKLDLAHRAVRPADSLSIHNESERQAVRRLAASYRALPRAQRQRLPALLNALGKLEVAAGDFESAQDAFKEVAGLVEESAARGEAHCNAYHAALEQGRYDVALAELRQAAACDERRFSLFPLAKYEPQRILGVGGFGVTFHCRYRATGGDVAVKVLHVDDLERDIQTVFQEAGALDQIQHPAIVRLRECDFADPEGRRPYLVMEYFDGLTLQELVQREGPLALSDFLAVAIPVAEALNEAHTRGILHRDIKPANLLVRRLPAARAGGTSGESPAWQVKLIDFGLALKQSRLATATTQSGQTVVGSSIAGTIDYAAPEQMGKLPGVRIGRPVDVFGFGKTCCYALFRTPVPLRMHWKQVPEPLADLLEGCLHENPAQRLPNFQAVLPRLLALREPRPVTPPPLPREAPSRDRPTPPGARSTPVARKEEAEEVRAGILDALPAEPAARSARVRKTPARSAGAEELRRERRQAPRPVSSGPKGMPRLFSALLAFLFLGGAFALGFGLDEPPGRSRTSIMLGGLCIVGAVATPFGFLLRTYRAWGVMLIFAIGMGVLCWVIDASTAPKRHVAGMNFVGGIAMGGLLGFLIALPVEIYFWLFGRKRRE
jgi:serine/threonine protein kinase